MAAVLARVGWGCSQDLLSYIFAIGTYSGCHRGFDSIPHGDHDSWVLAPMSRCFLKFGLILGSDSVARPVCKQLPLASSQWSLRGRDFFSRFRFFPWRLAARSRPSPSSLRAWRRGPHSFGMPKGPGRRGNSDSQFRRLS